MQQLHLFINSWIHLSCSLIIIIFYLYLGTPVEFTNCPTSFFCINETVSYQCRVDTSGGANTLQWRVLNATGGVLGAITYISGSSMGSPGSIGTQFTTNLTSTGASSIVSDITFTPTIDINNYTVECRAIDANAVVLIGTDTCSILIKGICVIQWC